MSPDQQQSEGGASREALKATINQLATQSLNYQIDANDLAVKLKQATALVQRCAAEHGPKPAEGEEGGG